MKDFKDIKYLANGTERQRQAYQVLNDLNIFKHLSEYDPILTGTIPLDIDVQESDLDFICNCNDHEKFSNLIVDLFGYHPGFEIHSKDIQGVKTTVASFQSGTFKLEIFGQNIPTDQQAAYRHLLIEARILGLEGIEFKNDVIRLKSEGIKTEPAFAMLLGLPGNPYEVLLELEIE